MWVHYMDVHGPYIAKRGWRVKNRLQAAMLWKKALRHPGRVTQRERERLIATYKEEIGYLDARLGALLHAVDRKKTLVILTADHGDLFGEHGLFGHSVKLYNGVLHVPLVISLPRDEDRNGRVITTPVRSMDLVPTLIDLLGLETPQAFEGRSLASLMTGRGAPYRCDHLISELSRKHLCVQTGEWKLIVNHKTNEKELYNLKSDPGETANLTRREPAVAAELERVLHDHLSRTPADTAPGAIPHNEAMKARLQALGYMD
jgi:arylsulfatase A-like enzyme